MAVFDVVWAIVCPPLTLFVTEAQILTYPDLLPAALYCAIALACTLATFVAFRIRDGLSQYFSVNDAIDVLKAVVVAELLTGAALFTLTRLEGVPRSAPIVHALMLGAGLVLSRLFVRMMHADNRPPSRDNQVVVEHILMVGLTRLSAQYIQLVDSLSSHRRQIVALLDDRPERVGRSAFGVKVVASANQIQSTVEEYAVHGIHIDRVIVGGYADLLSSESLNEVRRVCNHRGIPLDFVPDLIGLSELKVPKLLDRPKNDAAAPAISRAPYLRAKRWLDLMIAVVLIVALSPFLVLTGLLALFDVGSPVFFWQQRIGLNGRTFLLYKIRTLRAPFDWRGLAVPEEKRLSWIGQFLRNSRLDELPQLLNVMVGDMSLIGPRPLLPVDQPPNPSVRLSIRPGITGWAQVNGDVDLSPEEKNELDEWYVGHATPRLDFRIMLMTIGFIFRRKADPRPPVAPEQQDLFDTEAPAASVVSKPQPNNVVPLQNVGGGSSSRQQPPYDGPLLSRALGQ